MLYIIRFDEVLWCSKIFRVRREKGVENVKYEQTRLTLLFYFTCLFIYCLLIPIPLATTSRKERPRNKYACHVRTSLLKFVVVE